MSAATTTTLTFLPPELHDLILSFVATDIDKPSAAVFDLISIGSTCRTFHHAVFCETNDQIWRYPAYSIGVHSSSKLNNLLYPGSSQPQRHRWLDVVKLNFHLRKPFPTHKPAWPKVQKASRLIPPPLDDSGFGSQKKIRKRTVDLVISGEGTRNRTQYSTRHVDWRGDGSVRFMASNPDETGTARQELACVMDPSTARTDVLSCEVGLRPAWTPTPFPGMAGYSVEKKDGTSVVREVGRNFGQPLRKWTLEEDVDRVVSFDDILVAATFPVSRPLHSHIASRLVCAKTSKNGITSILWEIDIPGAWADDDSYTRYPHVKNFHISK